jgi:hypothetical protein
MSDVTKYLLDADSFIRAKREHYSFDFCPGFWDGLLRAFEQGQLCSIEPVRKELLRGNDALTKWVRDQVPEEFFEPTSENDVQLSYARVIKWAEGEDRYSRAAKHKFVRGADPWLIATAVTRQYTLVSYEVAAPESKALIKLPDVAKQFTVRCIPPYVMLRQLGLVLALEP